MSARHFPDKAIDIMSKACARAESQSLDKVDEEIIAEIISEMVDVPVGEIDEESRSRLLDLEYRLNRHIIGQTDALIIATGATANSKTVACAKTFLIIAPSFY